MSSYCIVKNNKTKLASLETQLYDNRLLSAHEVCLCYFMYNEHELVKLFEHILSKANTTKLTYAHLVPPYI